MSKENTQTLNVHQRIAKIRGMVEVCQKNASGYNYKYVSEEEVLAKVAAGMDKYGLNLYVSLVADKLEATHMLYEKKKTGRNGAEITETVDEFMVTGQLEYTWVNTDNPEDCLTVRWPLVGQQSDASQAVGSAMTYMNRYFLLKFFQVATPQDDPDNWRSKKKQAEDQANTELARQLIDEAHQLVSDHLAALSSEDVAKNFKATLAETVRKYAKSKTTGKPSANYYEITKPDVAAALLDEIRTLLKGAQA